MKSAAVGLAVAAFAIGTSHLSGKFDNMPFILYGALAFLAYKNSDLRSIILIATSASWTWAIATIASCAFIYNTAMPLDRLAKILLSAPVILLIALSPLMFIKRLLRKQKSPGEPVA